MKTLRSTIFFLTVFFTSAIQSELRPDTEKVCLQSEIYEETIVEKVKKPMKEYKKAGCMNLFKRFSCKKQVTRWKEVDEPRVVQKSRSVLKCCTGYKEIQENATRCVPVCSTGCVHGKCTAPDKCICMPGFQGPACSMRSVVTATNRDSALESSTQEIFQATEESELETSTPEILKITNTMTKTIGEVTVSMAEATVVTDAAHYEKSTTELDEKEISNEKFQNGEFTMAMDVKLDLPKLTKTSSEETKTISKYGNLKKAEGLENGVPNFSEKLSTAGNEILSNPKLILKFEEHISEPTKIYGKNLQVYDFTSLLYVLPVSCFVLGFALWIIVIRRKKSRESQTEIQLPFYSKEPLEFCAENILWRKLFRNRSESPIGMSEIEPNRTQPILLGLLHRNRSESPIGACEAEPNNAKPLLEGIFI